MLGFWLSVGAVVWLFGASLAFSLRLLDYRWDRRSGSAQDQRRSARMLLLSWAWPVTEVWRLFPWLASESVRLSGDLAEAWRDGFGR